MSESGKKAILLVEDETVLALSEKAALEAYGYAVQTVDTGEKAVAAVNASPLIDLILMDINLGEGIDGTEAAERILKDHDIPVVFLSSHREREIVEKTEKITSYGYVVKNSSITVLDASIKMAFKLFEARKSLQKKMEAFKASDDRFQLAMNELDGALWTLDRDLRFTLSRGRGLASLGLLPDQVVGMSLAEFLGTDDPDNESLAAHRQALLGRNVNYEYTYKGLTFRTAVSPLRDLHGDIIGVAGIGTDITQRKQVEDALRDSEEKFSKVFKGSPYPVMIIDMDNGRFSDVSEAMVRSVEFPREELIGHSAVELGILMPDTELQARKLIAEAGCFSDLEVAFRTKSGTPRIGMATGQVVEIGKHAYLIQTVIDMTERKKSEKAMAESELKYRSLIESSSDAIFCVDEKGEYQFTNHLFASTFGKTTDFFIGKTFWDIYPKEHADMRFAATRRVFQTGRSESLEVEVPLPDRTLYFYATANPIKDETGKVVLSLTHAVDITDRKRAEDEIKALLAEKELILKEVHHRVKNNMSVISSLLSLQAQSLKEPSALVALEDAKHRVQALMLLYDKLYQSSNYASVPVKDYLPALVDEIVVNFPNSTAVKVDMSVDDFTLDAKRLQPLGMIVNELVTNIMKYAFRGREGGTITVSATKAGGRVAVAIQDNGNGIPESTSVENSTGFGLKLVQALTAQLGGSIRIERGDGTKVVLEFGE